MKKFSSVFLLLLILVGCFGGCSSDNADVTSSENSGSSNTSSTESSTVSTDTNSNTQTSTVSTNTNSNTTQEKHMLDGKKIIFIGNSHTYYGKTVIEKSNNILSQAQRSNDKGFFYQLCKENGAKVQVTNWTFGGHDFPDIFETCKVNRTCKGTEHFSYLTDRNFDYVVMQRGSASAKSNDFVSYFQKVMSYFKEANPNVKFVVLIQHQAYVDNYDWLPEIKELDALGITVVDWGKLVYDVFSHDITVPGSKLDYNKNSFIVSKSATDGYHPNMLTGYITSLMTYCAITGEKAEGQPYAFCGDKSINASFNFEKFTNTYYTYGDTYTNFSEALTTESEVIGFQKLIDQYLEEKKYTNY